MYSEEIGRNKGEIYRKRYERGQLHVKQEGGWVCVSTCVLSTVTIYLCLLTRGRGLGCLWCASSSWVLLKAVSCLWQFVWWLSQCPVCVALGYPLSCATGWTSKGESISHIPQLTGTGVGTGGQAGGSPGTRGAGGSSHTLNIPWHSQQKLQTLADITILSRYCNEVLWYFRRKH